MATTNLSRRAPRTTAQLVDGDGAGSAPRQAPSEFSEGSVVSLHMKNFLVYKDVVAVFGPRLNVVVGPNGSGKSTLVCAIALGLGGSPKVLGRADNLSSFVMHGVKEDASITVELFIPKGQNIKITRTFSRKNNSSNWHINGRSHSDKQVKDKISALGIQVDNLCTMLPQDKVGDFSGFSPEKLLLETEKALSYEQSYTPHLQLVEMQESSGKKLNEQENTKTKLEGMEMELSHLEKDVQRFQERQEKKDKLEMHVKRKAWVKVENLREKGMQAKSDLKEAERELKEAKKEDEPLEAELRRWEKEDQRLRGIVASRNRKRDGLEEKLSASSKKVEKMIVDAKSQKVDITNMETRRKNKEEKLAKSKLDLVEMQKRLEGLRAQRAASASPEELIRDITAKQDEAAVVKQDLKGQEKIMQDAKMSIRETETTIKELTNLKTVRRQKFVQHFRESANIGLKVRDWAERNSDKLRGPVAGPIALDVTVEDPEAATALETHVPNHMWCSVVVNSKEDHDTILKAFSNQRISLSVLVNEGGGLKPFQPMFSKEEMARMKETAGVRGFLDDFVSCPDTIRQTLRRNVRIHKTFLGNAVTQHKIATDPTFLPSLGKSVNGIATGSVVYAGGSHGASGRQAIEPIQQYQTKISLYGQRKPSVRVSETRPAQAIGRGVDADAVAAQQADMATLKVRHQAAEEKAKKIQNILRELTKEVESAKNAHRNAQTLLNNEKKAAAGISRTERNIKDYETELSAGEDVEKVAKINRLEKVFEQHAISVEAAQQHLSEMLDASVEFTAATLAKGTTSDKLSETHDALRQARENRIVLEEKVRELTRTAAQALKDFKAEKKIAETTAARCVEGSDNVPNAFGAMYEELPSSMAELDAVIDDLKSDLSTTVNNPQVVHKYEKLKKDVAELQTSLSELTAQNSSEAEMMESICAPWTEYLEHMVDKLNTRFNDYMSKMDGCYGEVVLAKDESYKKWGVEIKVRFRSEADEGKLAVLNKHVHSGGERSVSTILYLMALQDMQNSPFRVVDEINQGMDPKNERGVFSRIVLNSCGPTRKQYFLITPKLLQGLVAMDNDDVTVIFIMNGLKTINGTPELSMSNFIKAKKRQLAQSGEGPDRKHARLIT